MLALVDGQPQTLPLRSVLVHYLDHRREIIRRRTEFDLEKARARAHILEGLKIALDNLDAVIKTIRESADVEVARSNLMTRFDLSELQAQAILDMRKRVVEYDDVINKQRETIYAERDKVLHNEDLTETGYGKRVALSEFRRKHRGGQGVRLIALEGKKTGSVAAVQQVTEEDEELVLISEGGQVIRTETN